jgi:cytochrome c2
LAILASADPTEAGVATQANDIDAQPQALGSKAQAIDGAKLFEACTSCHGTLAPGPQTMAALTLEDFMSRIDIHMNVGGMVASLSSAEKEAIHRYLKNTTE